MADALTQAYDTAAAAGGPGAVAALQIGRELGAKPPGTVTVIHPDPSAYDSNPQEKWGLAYEILAALLQAGLAQQVDHLPSGPGGVAPGLKPVPWIRRPDAGGWTNPATLLLVASFFKARAPNKDDILKAARYFSGDLNGSQIGPTAGEGPLPPLFVMLQLFLYMLVNPPPTPASRNKQGGLLGGVKSSPERAPDRRALWISIPFALAVVDWLVRRRG